MPPSKRSEEIANAFHRFVKTGDKSTIENIEYEELKIDGFVKSLSFPRKRESIEG